MKINDHFNLGVINITPNSFSDTERLIEDHHLIKKLLYFKQFKNIVWDIGFESTAPMNQPISIEEERKRFNYFIRTLKKNSIKIPLIISIDSYKLENYQYFYNELTKLNKRTKVIFNDVSGCMDDYLIEFLRSNKNAYYIYCFTEIKSREVVHRHMQSLNVSRDVVKEMLRKFSFVINTFTEHKIAKKLILDPAFGFSKTMEENWILIDTSKAWSKEIKRLGFYGPILVGISKKSFLHKMISTESSKEDSEFIHYEVISRFKENVGNHYVFRVHDPAILNN